MTVKTFKVCGSLGEYEHELPAVYVVCPKCEGHGAHLAPSIGEHAYSREEFYEAFSDEDDRAEYFKRGGRYDVPCTACDGRRVVLEVDQEAAKLTGRGRRLLALYDAVSEREAAWRREEAYERKYGY